MVFQSYAIWPHLTVFENVAYPLRVRRRPAAEIKERVSKEQELKWSGRIAHTTYRGAIRSVVVQAENGRLTIDAAASCNYSVGDNVKVVAHQGAAWAIRKDETLR